MDSSTCKFCDELYLSYEYHICKYENCIPSIMKEINGYDFQIPLQDCCDIQESSSSLSESGNLSVSCCFDNLNYCLNEEKSFLQDKATLSINPAYMNDETACNFPILESNKNRYPHDCMKISPPTSLNYISEISNEKANIPFAYLQTNDSYVHDVETQINYCLNEEKSFLQDKATLSINPAYLNDETACNFPILESNTSRYPHDYMEISPPASPNYISEISNQKANIPFVYLQTNDNYVHDVETQINPITEHYCCDGSDVPVYIEFANQVSELSYEELPRSNSFAVHQQFATEKGNSCISAFIEASINPSSADIQLKSNGNFKLSKQLCNNGSIVLSLETKFNEHPVIHSDCQSFNSDICLTEFIHGSTFNKKNPDIQLKSPGNSKLSKQLCNNGSIDLSLKTKFNEHPGIHSDCQSFSSDIGLTELIHGSTFNKKIPTRDSAIVVAGPSLSMPFKKKEINNERKDYTDDEPTAIDLSKPLNDKPIRPECVNELKSKENLKSHLKRHSKEKQFVCGSCHKSFTEKATLKYHIFITTGKEPFQCAFCKKNFMQRCGLIIHAITHIKRKLL